MEIINHNNEKCVVIPLTIWNTLQEKVLAQRELIEEYQEEMKRL